MKADKYRKDLPLTEEGRPVPTMPKKKVLFCYVNFHHYRVPIWEELSEIYDVTVLHGSEPQTGGRAGFREISDPPIKIWRFRYQSRLLREVRRGNYDAVIFLFDLAWISHLLGFILCPRRTRRITWGFWETKTKIANRVRLWFAKRAHGNVFYATGAAKYFMMNGLDARRIWIARNTVAVAPARRDSQEDRDTILFLGSFNTRKRNDVAISAFNEACAKIPPNIRLVLVGDGPAKPAVVEQAAILPNEDRIEFHPGTLDDEAIRTYYARALASVSFGQAGLSALQSLGHGVPFITSREAISGGEIENIIHNRTGILCEPSEAELARVFVELCTNQALSERLGRTALEYYIERCTAECMAKGFAGAIEDRQLILSETIS